MHRQKKAHSCNSELKLRNSFTIIANPLKRKKHCKKVILGRKKFKRSAYPQPIINVAAPQGIQGPQGPQGIPGIPGPAGSMTIPHISTMLTAERYLYIANADIALPTDIPANQFTNDDGESITEFRDFDLNSYVNLYINGMMQVGGTYSVNTNALTIKHDHGIIYADTPIILETVRLSVQIIP